ncbi:phosducin-like protein [Uranotaenia lowii]|uniref:phosducin-like protein n=1 Tax=Uranotaenia lowii TaxID=190385 RepID=UPI00247833C3|nr:phosducin-like protein [Uranotaenia lowii]
MATLEDKILGEKLQNYCSSSEDENENDDTNSGSKGQSSSGLKFIPEDKIKDQAHWSGSAANTGPKGVIRDWQRFKQLETEKREEQEKEKFDLLKKLSITARTHAEDEAAKERDQLDRELEELMSDDFLLEYQKKRMAEMLAQSGKLPSFGTLIELSNGDDFLKTVDDEPKAVTIVIHIYDRNDNACRAMNKALQELSSEYVNVKFCKFMSSVAGLSNSFKCKGVPALLIYKAGQMIGNFIRVTDDLSDNFNSSDVESFLTEVGMLPDKTAVPYIVK